MLICAFTAEKTPPVGRSCNLPRRRLAFTVVEVLVVIAVIALLIALLIPAVQQARESARRLQCANDLKQIGLGIANYESVHGSLPPGQLVYQGLSPSDLGILPSAWIMILPFLEQKPLYDSINFNLPIQETENRTSIGIQLGVYMCPSDFSSGVRPSDLDNRGANGLLPRTLLTSYVACYGAYTISKYGPPPMPGFIYSAGGSFYRDPPTRLASITDGLSNTLFASERAISYFDQLSTTNPTLPLNYGRYFQAELGDALFTTYYPLNMPRKVSAGAGNSLAFAASSLHIGGVNALLGDMSVRFIKESINTWNYDNLTGEPVGFFSYADGTWSQPVNPGIWQMLSTRAAGEAVDGNAF
jgi:type II secretory pathway pseudopilin PulG